MRRTEGESLCKGLKDGGGTARLDPEKKKKWFLPRGLGDTTVCTLSNLADDCSVEGQARL